MDQRKSGSLVGPLPFRIPFWNVRLGEKVATLSQFFLDKDHTGIKPCNNYFCWSSLSWRTKLDYEINILDQGVGFVHRLCYVKRLHSALSTHLEMSYIENVPARRISVIMLLKDFKKILNYLKVTRELPLHWFNEVKCFYKALYFWKFLVETGNTFFQLILRFKNLRFCLVNCFVEKLSRCIQIYLREDLVYELLNYEILNTFEHWTVIKKALLL